MLQNLVKQVDFTQSVSLLRTQSIRVYVFTWSGQGCSCVTLKAKGPWLSSPQCFFWTPGDEW